MGQPEFAAPVPPRHEGMSKRVELKPVAPGEQGIGLFVEVLREAGVSYGELSCWLMIPIFSMAAWVPNGFESAFRRSKMRFACGAGAKRATPRLANRSE